MTDGAIYQTMAELKRDYDSENKKLVFNVLIPNGHFAILDEDKFLYVDNYCTVEINSHDFETGENKITSNNWPKHSTLEEETKLGDLVFINSNREIYEKYKYNSGDYLTFSNYRKGKNGGAEQQNEVSSFFRLRSKDGELKPSGFKDFYRVHLQRKGKQKRAEIKDSVTSLFSKKKITGAPTVQIADPPGGGEDDVTGKGNGELSPAKGGKRRQTGRGKRTRRHTNKRKQKKRKQSRRRGQTR